MIKDANKCSRCGQSLDLVDEDLEEYQALHDDHNNLLCLRCYRELCDRKYH